MIMGNVSGQLRRVGKRAPLTLERSDSGISVDEMPMFLPKKLNMCKDNEWQLCRKLNIFSSMDARNFDEVMRHFRIRSYKEGKTLIEQGSDIHNKSEMHVILSGTIHLTAEGSQPLDVVAGPGEIFGVTALLFKVPRSATARASSHSVKTLALSYERLRPFIRVMPAARLLIFMRQQLLLQSLSDYSLEKLAHHVQCRTYKYGERLIVKGTPGHEIFLIRKGSVRVLVTEEVVVRRGAVLGQRALNGKLRTATCVVEDSPVEVVVISDRDFSKVKDPVLDRILACDAIVAVQQHSRVFGSFTTDQMTDVLRSLEEFVLSENSPVVEKGTAMDGLYVVKDGKIKGDTVLEAGGFQYCGSVTGAASLEDAFVVSKQATIIKCTRSNWLETLVQRKRSSSCLSMKDLKLQEDLGSGESGRVRLAEVRNAPDEFVAVKIVRKNTRAYKTGHVVAEGVLMMSLSNPFCVRLQSVDEDETHFYLIMEYVPGGELFHHLSRQQQFSESAAKFYTGCVVLALEYLHVNGIIYRDLKPENLLLDELGYIKVTDFGYSKRIGKHRAFTMCGTPEYQAPEITAMRGATTCADLWSLGVLVYEMLTGRSPFLSKTVDDPFVITRNARSGRYPPPHGYVGTPVNDLISKLLQVDTSQRLSTTSAVKNHAWFSGFNWVLLKNKRMQAPFRPGKRPEFCSLFRG